MDKPPLTLAMAEKQYQQIKNNRKGRLAACTRKMNDVKALLEPNGDIEKVNEGVAIFLRSLNELKG